MKKIMFIVAAILLSTIMFSCKNEDNKGTDPTDPTENPTDPKEDPTDPKEEEVYPEVTTRNCILLEEFTGQSCGNCPRAIAAIRAELDAMANGDRVAWVAHHSGYYSDKFTLQGDLTIASALGVNYAPAAVLERTKTQLSDGDNSYVHIADYAADSTVLNNLLAVPAEASMNMKVTMAADSTLTVTILGKSNKAEAYMTVLLCQNGINSNQAGVGQNYTHNEVVRAYLTTAAGEQITVDGETKKYNFVAEYKIPAEIANYDNSKSFATDIPNMYVVAFVHGKLSSKGAVYNTDMFKLANLK